MILCSYLMKQVLLMHEFQWLMVGELYFLNHLPIIIPPQRMEQVAVNSSFQ